MSRTYFGEMKLPAASGRGIQKIIIKKLNEFENSKELILRNSEVSKNI